MANMAERDKLRSITVEDLASAYHDGEITKLKYDALLVKKAYAEREALLEKMPYGIAIFNKSLDEFQKGWDNLVEAAQHPVEASGDSGSDVRRELYYAGLAMWGQAQMLLAPFSAIGDITGNRVENMALMLGATPGGAHLLSIAANVGTGFLFPVGTGARGLAKDVQKIGTEELGKAVGKAPMAEHWFNQVISQSVADGLRADGVSNASNMVNAAARAAGHDITLTGDAAKAAAIASTSQGLLAAANKAVNEPTAENAAVFARSAIEMFTGAPQGERLSYTKNFMDMLTHLYPEHMAKGSIYGAMKEFAVDLTFLSEDGMKQVLENGKKVFDAMKNDAGAINLEALATGWYRFREVYVNALLPFAWAPSILGNMISTGTAVAERALGGMFSAGTGGVVADEAFYMMKGLTFAMGDGIKAIASSYHSRDLAEIAGHLGVTVADVRKMAPEKIFAELQAAGVNPSTALQGVSKLDFMPGEVPGALGRIVRFNGDNVRATDTFFKVILERASYYADAIREATQAGMSGAQAGQYVANMVGMGPKPAEYVARATRFALENTFQNDLGAIARRLQQTLQTGPAFLYFPFMKTFLNTTKYAWNRTPGLQLMSQQLYTDIMAGGVQADMAIGRLTMSNLLGIFTYELAKDGYITGSGPVDPALQKAWLATHTKYAVKSPSGYVPFGNMEPGTQPVGFIADMTQVTDQLQKPTAEKLAMATGFAIMKNFGSSGWAQSFSNIIDGIQGLVQGKEFAPKLRDFLMSPVTNLTAIPTMGFAGGRAARIVDPIMRDVRSYTDRVMAQVPGFSKDVPPVRDGYGDPIIPPQAMGNSWFGLFQPLAPRLTPDATDRVKKEGDRLMARLPNFGDTIGGAVSDNFDISEPQPGDRQGVPLTGKQRDKWQEIYRNLVRSDKLGIEATLLNNEMYKNMPTALQRELFNSKLQDYKSLAEKAMFLDDKDLREKLNQANMDSLIPKAPAAMRGAAQEKMGQAEGLLDTLAPDMVQKLIKWGILDNPADSRPFIPNEGPPRAQGAPGTLHLEQVPEPEVKR